jgi:hypothetical protein
MWFQLSFWSVLGMQECGNMAVPMFTESLWKSYFDKSLLADKHRLGIHCWYGTIWVSWMRLIWRSSYNYFPEFLWVWYHFHLRLVFRVRHPWFFSWIHAWFSKIDCNGGRGTSVFSAKQRSYAIWILHERRVVQCIFILVTRAQRFQRFLFGICPDRDLHFAEMWSLAHM